MDLNFLESIGMRLINIVVLEVWKAVYFFEYCTG